MQIVVDVWRPDVRVHCEVDDGKYVEEVGCFVAQLISISQHLPD